MASKSGLFPPIYRIDVEATRTFYGEEVPIAEIPRKIVDSYNASKGVTTYQEEGTARFENCQLFVFRKAAARSQLSYWVPFYEPSGIAIEKVLEQSNHLVGFVVLGEDDGIYVHTGGHSAVVFERFVDVSFPIEIARRIAEPKVKRARSSQISGSTLVSDVNFRDPRRITYTESLQNVWTGFGGGVRPEVLAEPSLRAVFGVKKAMRLDVFGAIKFGPRVDSLDKLISLIRWLAEAIESPLPADDEWAILDSIRVLNPRKSKDLINRLNGHLAKKLAIDGDYSNIAITHVDASLYANATSYFVTRGQTEIYAGDQRPEISDVLNSVVGQAGVEVSQSLLASTFIRSQCSDYGPDIGTRGTLLEHLHGELRFEGHTYFILAGRWYKVDGSYIDLVTKDFVGLVESLDVPAAEIGMKKWEAAKAEGVYNLDSVDGEIVINGDLVLTDNVELFDTLRHADGHTYIIHVKRGFDVKVRDLRSQIINSAMIIENDLRVDDPSRLKRHHSALARRGRTTLTEDEFLELFEHPRTYVFAYGTKVKVERATVDGFESTVARMEVVMLNGQFRQIASEGHVADLRIAWLEIVD